MKQTSYIKSAVLISRWVICILLVGGLFSSSSYGQCIQGSAFGTQTLSASVGGSATIGCNFAGEYGTWNGAVTGNTYTFTSTVGTDYLTISTAPGGPGIAFGTQPLVWTSTITGTIYVHVSTNAACGTAGSCRDITGTTTALAPVVVLTPYTGSNSIPCGQASTLCTHAGCGATYSTFADGHTIINAANSAVVNINGSYSTESGFDFITIYNGSGTGGTIAFGPVSGSGIINFTGVPGQTYTIRFTSDVSINSTGYNLAVTYTGSCLPPSLLVPFTGSNSNPCGTNVTLCTHAGCGLNYSPNADGNTVLLSGGTAVININGSYSTESGFDFITIYSGAGTGGPIVFGPVSGTGVINYTGLPGQILTVRFTSDVSVQSTGFSLAVSYSGLCALPCLISASATASPAAICAGGSSTLTANAAGNNGAVSYLWSTSATTQSISASSAGVYTVTVTDAVPAGCTASATVQLTVNPVPSVSATANPTSVACASQTVQLTASPTPTCLPNYTLAPISYSPVTGTPIQGPIGDDALSAGIPIGFNFPFYCGTKSTIYISTNGFVTFDPLAGSGCCAGQTLPNAFSPNDLIALAWTDLYAPNPGMIMYYNLTSPNRFVVEYNGVYHCCSAPAQVTGQIILYQDGTIEVHSTSILANGTMTQGIEDAAGSNGTAVSGRNGVSFSATNDAYRFTPVVTPGYSWSPNAGMTGSNTFNPTVTGISSTTIFTVTATNEFGCTATATTQVTFNPVTASCSGTDNVCFGGSTGTAAVVPGGGSPGYTFTWSNGSTTASISGLTAGTYCVTVTDINGCTGTCCYTVNQPTAVSATAVSTNASCPFCPDGTVSISSVSGGTPGYTFTNLTGLLPGNYCITVTDANGCTGTACATVGAAGCTMSANASQTSAVSCFGGNNGSALSAPTGGIIGPLTYLWSNGATTAAIGSLSAGTYTVIVNDLGSGCVDQGTVTITQPSLLTASCSGTNNICNGGTSGTASVVAGGGTLPYSYVWSNGGTDASQSGLSAGTYCVTVTDANGCTATCCYTVTQPAAIAVSSTVTNITQCSYSTTGGINISVSGGTPGTPSPLPPLTYDFDASLQGWTTGIAGTLCFTGASVPSTWNSQAFGFSGQSYGTTSVGGEHTYIQSPVINLPASLTLTAKSWSNNEPGYIYPGCTGYDVEYVEYSTDGGTTWTPFFTTNQANLHGSNLATWSTLSYTVPITPTSNGRIRFRYDNADGCCGGSGINNGWYIDDVSISQGLSSPYSFVWSNGATTEDLSNVGAGVYTVTITDGNGCTTTASYTITAPPAIAISGTTVNTCTPGGNGDVNISISGGTPLSNYVYNFNGSLQGWTTGIAGAMCFGASGPSTWINQAFGFSGQSYGTTSVGGEHSYIQSPIITLPSTLSLSAKSWSNNEPGFSYPSCTGYDVEFVEYSTDGGATWTPFFTTNQANLHGSNMSVWNTLSYTASITPTSNGRIRFRYDNADGCCGGSGTNNGWYIDDVTISAPPGGYYFLWSNGATTEDLSGVPAGTYTVTVTDANGCTSTASYTILAPAVALSATCGGTNALCNGDANGSASVTAADGIPPYSYNWSNGSTNSSISGLIAGTYCVTVTDAMGCSAICCYTVTEPAVLLASCSGTNALCNGDANGTAAVSESGGTGPYSYLWSNGGNTNSITGLLAGTYCVTVTDANGCTATCCYTVTEPAVLLTLTAQTNVSCFGGSDGMATANPTGGTAPYSYAWSNGSTSQTTTGLSAGTYSVIVTDANLCTTLASVIITEPPQLVISETHVDVSCNGGGNGSIDLTLVGGTPPFTFLWSNGATTEDLVNLSSSTYFVTITEANGCTSALSVTVTQPTALAAGFVVTNVTCFSAGSIDLTTSGGTPGYSWLWSNGATTEDISGLTTGTYTVVITDANGCSITKSKTVGLTNTLVISAVVSNASCGLPNGSATVTVTGGTAPYTYAWATVPVQTTATATGLSAGVVSVTVTDAFGCTKTKNITITNSNGLGVKLTSPVFNGGWNISCNGGSDGSATALPLYSTGPYSFIWSTGATTQTISGLGAGTYTVTVTNGGCTATGQITLKQPNPLAITFVKTNVSCFGGANGTAKAVKTGGTNPVTYSWNTIPVQTTQTATGLSAGVYTVTITDANGCTAAANVTITQPAAGLSVTGVTTDLNCFNINTGTITLTVAGGTSPYTYLWSTGATSKNRTGLAAGTYTVTVTDSKGCVTSATFTINQPPALVVTTTKTNVSCNGGNNGTATANASGGTPGYTYSWNTVPVQTNATATGLTAGTKTCTVTDTKGCTKTVSVTINQPAAISIATTQTNVSTNGGNDGAATANPSGGISPYGYTWSNGGTTQTISGLTAGAYTVIVTDANGCTKSKTVTITQPGPRISGSLAEELYSLNLFPNPNNGVFSLTFESDNQYQYMVQVIDVTGRMVYSKSFATSTGVNKQSFDFSLLPKGVYMMNVNTNSQHRIIKVVIE